MRCGVVFYLTVSAFSPLSPADANQTRVAGTYINRYDLSTNTPIGAPILIGEASTWAGAEGAVDYAGWDVSQDGMRIAYQTEHVTAGPTIASSWFAANADGTGAVTILDKLPSSQGARMAISPNGKLVAVTEAMPGPDVASGSMAGGLPTRYSMSATRPNAPLGFAQPAWTGNSQKFIADSDPQASPIAVDYYTTSCGGPLCQGTQWIAKVADPISAP